MSSSPRGSYVVRGVLATIVLYYASRLSVGDRGVVDYVVLTAIGLCIAWNVFRLGQRLHASGGGRASWHVLRTTLFWFLGLGYTVFGRAEYEGTWRMAMGWILLVIALCDTVALYRRERAVLQPPPEAVPH